MAMRVLSNPLPDPKLEFSNTCTAVWAAVQVYNVSRAGIEAVNARKMLGSSPKSEDSGLYVPLESPQRLRWPCEYSVILSCSKTRILQYLHGCVGCRAGIRAGIEA